MADTLIYIPVTGSIELIPLNPVGPLFVDTADMTFMALNPFAYPGFTPEELARARTVFHCIVTGAADGLDDLLVPIASFSANVREGTPTYLSCKIPQGDLYYDAIAARSNGDIVIKSGLRFADGSEYLQEIVRVNYEYTGVERMPTDHYLTVVGHKTLTLGQSKEWTLSGASYYSEDSEGKRRVRGAIDFLLRCGDICTYGSDPGESLVVGSISYSVVARPAMATMEIEEA